MISTKGMAICCLALATGAAIAQVKSTPRNRGSQVSPQGQPASSDRGQQVFNENCSRCHNAPEGFSQSISGTIARHMRVRANLNEPDYKALLQFFNP